MNRILMIISFFFLAIQSEATVCTPEPKWNKYSRYDAILIGRVIKVGKSFYEVEVQERFKGSFSNIVQGLISSQLGNSIYPRQGETWLFYGDMEGGKLFVHECSESKNLERPYGLNSIYAPTPPPLRSNEIEIDFFDRIQRNGVLDELYYEILSLRQWKQNKELNLYKDETSKIFNWLYLVIGLQIVIIILLITISIRK